MGLPIWRDPDEKQKKNAPNPDPTANARSLIRRRRYVELGEGANRPRPGPATRPPRFRRSLGEPPYSRRRHTSGVPPISTLLEHANRPRGPLSLVSRADIPAARSYLDSATNELQRQAAELEGRLDNFLQEHIPAGQLERPQRLADRQHLESLLAVLRRESSSAVTTPTDGRAGQSGTAPATDITSASPNRTRPASPDGPAIDRGTPPTPPLEATTGSDHPMYSYEVERYNRAQRNRRLHPLSNSWRPESPVDGLGDRNRSPTPMDGWEIMRTTITPDAALPSADSSFTSAVVSQSFGSNHDIAERSSSNDITVSMQERSSSSEESQRNSSEGDDQSDSASSLDGDDDLYCDATEEFANEMYNFERCTSAGLARINAHRANRHREGNRFALSHEPEYVDLGFRLIEEALESEDGRERLTHVGLLVNPEDSHISRSIALVRRRTSRMQATAAQPQDLTAHASIMDDEPPSPHPERMPASSRYAAREARRQLREYQRRQGTGLELNPPPPPQLSSYGIEVSLSRDGPEPHPVSSPSREREVSESGEGEEDTDLDTMRRVVERLAQRDDVPDDWWTSIGLNFSRARPRRVATATEDGPVGVGDRARTVRAERTTSGGSRL